MYLYIPQLYCIICLSILLLVDYYFLKNANEL